MTGLLLTYVSRETMLATEDFLISSGDNILNCKPIILDGVVLDLASVILILVLEIFRLFFQFILN